jgi:hypothetical protein
MTLDDLAARLDEAGAELTTAASALRRSDPGASAFGGEAAGRLGDLGRDLHRGWLVAIENRAREAAAHGARMSGTAEAVRRAAAGYAEADEAVRRQAQGAGGL